jgi:hypothetical protein
MDMQRIFEDEGRRLAPIAPNPAGTGPIFPPAASKTPCGGMAPRRRLLLAGGKIGSRQTRNITVNRP